MKKLLLVLAALLFISPTCFAQKLTLAELIGLCGKQNWEGVNSNLLAKGWVYHDSQNGDNVQYNTITWSYNKNSYNNKAQGWFYLFTFDSQPDKISYVTLSKAFYTQIQSSLTSTGFKLIGSKIEDGEVVSTYANATYVIKISTQKRDEDEWSDASLTAYQITVIRKAGIYDPDNGKKTSYYDDGELETEYFLKNGELHGQFKSYYRNGQLQKQGFFADGNENGKFIEYDSLGSKKVEYYMLNGELNGTALLYEQGKKSIEKNYVNGVQTGKYTEYYYDEESGNLNFKITGATKNGENDGKWVSYFIEDGKEEVVAYGNYKNGVKHGEVKEFIGADTIEIANYTDGRLNGLYKRQVKVHLTVPETGERSFVWAVDSEGEYENGSKNGKWVYSDLLGKLSEGLYINDLREGKWIYYTPVGVRADKVMAETNYVKGKKNGIEKSFFVIDKVEAPTGDKLKFYYKVYPVQEVATFKNDLLNGSYELKDSTGVLISKGTFLNDEKHGHWIEGYSRELADGTKARLYFEGEYLNGKEEGKWIAYFDRNIIVETLNFKAGELNGEYIVWNKLGKPSEIKILRDGNLEQLTTYDSAGEKPLTKYEIYNESSASLMCRQTEYLSDKTISQEYRIFRQEKIHHADFEKVFRSLTGVISSGIYGYKDGEYKVTTPKGDLLVKGDFIKENKVGLWAYHYPEQDVVLEQNYASGQPLDEKYKTLSGQPFSGEFVYHDATAGLKEERKIKDGVRNGKTTYLDSNNKMIRKENYKNGALK
ncbi:toxin-antitoxin system YwqK family antitoxin [uncultured Pontibacter sp.]|uniref:toxin-antitoxin system YwqK family antitoxin n=1 Tax=uncultured Pontibacter sp. TaxID=453356 RepID=UPI0026019D92|nr:toxin-antitoxin system YwqK family antitoxin [uncultured Pontibacter sp.]